ncbi:MAG: MBL fold metallo-hydrolase [Natronomonas sp.]
MNDTDDWYQIRTLSEDSWEIREGTMFGMYLVRGDSRALLIDTGCGVGDLRRTVSDLVDVPVTVLLSHSHWDHLGGAHAFDDVLIHDLERTGDGRVPPDVVTDDFGYGPEDWIADWHGADRSFPDGFDPDRFRIETATGVDAVEPGTTIDLGGKRVELVHVPGHSPGQLAVLDRESSVCFGGDVLHADHDLYVHFDGCDLRDYHDTLERLWERVKAEAFETLYVSHAEPVSGDDMLILETLRDGIENILADDIEYELVDDHPPARRYEIGETNVLTTPNAV